MYGSSGGDDDPGYEDEEDDDGFRIRRVITPTHYLENELFWGQAAYVRTNEFGLTDEEGFVCMAETVEGVAELAHAAYDRLAIVLVIVPTRRMVSNDNHNNNNYFPPRSMHTKLSCPLPRSPRTQVT